MSLFRERTWKLCLLNAVACLVPLGAAPSHASVVTFTATSGTNAETGNTVSATAAFSYSGGILTLVLTNTSSATLVRGDVLTGFAWTINPDGASIVMYPNGTGTANPILTDGTDNLFVLDDQGTKTKSDDLITTNNGRLLGGSYTDQLGSANPAIGDFGVSTTGFSNFFAGSGITLGNRGASDYGVVADNSFDLSKPNGNKASSYSDSLVGSLPLAQNSVTFTFTVTGNFDITYLETGKFLFGTSGTGIVTGTRRPDFVEPQPVPEPTTMALWSALTGIGLLVSRKRRVAR